MAGIVGNIIIGEVNTYETLSEEAKSILGRAEMMTYFEQAKRSTKLTIQTCLELAINLAKIYLVDLFTKSEGTFRGRISTAMSYIIIAARTIFDHIPTQEEQQTLPTTSAFFKNHIMKHLGVTSRNSIVRQAMTILGTDNIVNLDNLKPSENSSTYPTGIYTMNLLQAGGFNTRYYRNQEGTQETVNKTAFVMATGHTRVLECTDNPTNYEIILRACEHRMAKNCLQFQPNTTENQDQQPKAQTVAHTQQPETNIPISVSVITGTSPIIQAQNRAKKRAQPLLPHPPHPISHHSVIRVPNHIQETRNHKGTSRGPHQMTQQNIRKTPTVHFPKQETEYHTGNYEFQELPYDRPRQTTSGSLKRKHSYEPEDSEGYLSPPEEPAHIEPIPRRSRQVQRSNTRRHRSQSTGSNMGYEQNNDMPPCRWERRPEGCRAGSCRFRHSKNEPNREAKWKNYLNSIDPAQN